MDVTINIILLVVAVGFPSVACFVINASWMKHLSSVNNVWKDQCVKTNKDWGEFSSDVIGSNRKLNEAILESWRNSVTDPSSIDEGVAKIELLTKESREAGEALVKKLKGSDK